MCFPNKHDSSKGLKKVLINSNAFCAFMNMRENEILTSVIEIQKDHLGITTHFLTMINQQYL